MQEPIIAPSLAPRIPDSPIGDFRACIPSNKIDCVVLLFCFTFRRIGFEDTRLVLVKCLVLGIHHYCHPESFVARHYLPWLKLVCQFFVLLYIVVALDFIVRVVKALLVPGLVGALFLCFVPSVCGH